MEAHQCGAGMNPTKSEKALSNASISNVIYTHGEAKRAQT